VLTPTTASTPISTVDPTFIPSPTPGVTQSAVDSDSGSGIQPLWLADPDYDYVVVENEFQFRDAINAVNNGSQPDPFRIYLRPTVYTFTEQLLIQPGKRVRIFGMGAATEIRSNVPGTSFIYFANATLELYDLTLTNLATSSVSVQYGGAIFNNGGTLKISGVKFQNYLTTNGAGAVYSVGTLYITRSIFFHNRAVLRTILVEVEQFKMPDLPT